MTPKLVHYFKAAVQELELGGGCLRAVLDRVADGGELGSGGPQAWGGGGELSYTTNRELAWR